KKVVVNEAVELTKQFSDDDHYKFVNGVLSNIND
ncbi:MAG: transcription antitermination factor NusB, partial [Staphylococcus epidermidis]|nr:transcription antitermination factor NusB [Staphylococcus epidermidis]